MLGIRKEGSIDGKVNFIVGMSCYVVRFADRISHMQTYGDRLEAALLVQIKVELVERDMTQQDLAKKMGIEKATLNRYLKGHTAMKMGTFYELAEALEVTPQELMQRAGRRVEQEARTA